MLYEKYQVLLNQLIEQAVELAAGYHLNYARCLEQTTKRIGSTQFASVGKSALHRGYYCPNPIIERLVGNNSRGRLVKNNGKTSNFCYYFDCNKALIGVRKININLICDEFLIYTNNVCWGIEYVCKSDTAWFHQISGTVFEEGKVFLTAAFLFDATRIINVNGWCFDYTADGLMSAALSSDCAVHNGVLDDRDFVYYYDFLHDSDGNITHYRCIQPPVWTRENQEYRVLSKPIKQESWQNPRGMLPSYRASLKK